MIMVKCDWAHDHCDQMSDDDPDKALIMMKGFLFFRCHQDDEGTIFTESDSSYLVYASF